MKKVKPWEWRSTATAWETYYTRAHMETILRRAAVFDLKVSHLSGLLYMFGKTVEAEGVHPLQSGLIRLKFRRDRRHGMPLESPLTFYPRYAKEFLVRYGRVAIDMLRLERIRRRVLKDPQRYAYTDQALAAGHRRGDRYARTLQPQRRGARRGQAHAPDCRADARQRSSRRAKNATISA